MMVLRRTSLIVLVAAALWLALLDRSSRQRQAADVRNLLEAGGLDAKTAAEVLREGDPMWQRIHLSQSLVASVLQSRTDAAVGPREAALAAARAPERLETAQRVAREVAVARPAVWQAWMLDGASTYLLWSLRGDSRVFTDRVRWEAPLQRAMTLAPGMDEPQRFLAAAYIEIWPVLDEQERRDAEEAVAVAFQHEATMALLIGPWLELNRDLEQAFATVPDRPSSWRQVESALRRRGDLAGLVSARQRWYRALADEIPGRLEIVEQALRGGDPRVASRELFAVVAMTPPRRQFAPWISRALEQLPPGAVAAAPERALQQWLHLATDAYVHGLPGLSQAAVRRLVAALDDLPPPRRALAEIAAGRDRAAARIAADSEDLNTERWLPFLLGRARRLVEKGDPAGARRSLDTIHPAWADHPIVLELRSGSAGDSDLPVALAQAGDRWPTTAWRWRNRVTELDLPAVEPGLHVVVRIDQAPPRGAVVELLINFDGAWLGVAETGTEIAVPVPAAGPCHLRFVTITGGAAVPGEVWLALPSARDTV